MPCKVPPPRRERDVFEKLATAANRGRGLRLNSYEVWLLADDWAVRNSEWRRQNPEAAAKLDAINNFTYVSARDAGGATQQKPSAEGSTQKVDNQESAASPGERLRTSPAATDERGDSD
jgi:hypothetical protein